jgi:uncharacterized RDD family membrane protein YckC
MSYTGPGAAGTQPHAYDPVTQPELFAGVLERRVVAFLIDAVVIVVPLALFAVFFLVVTLGLGILLLVVIYGPICVIWALVYYGMTLGGPASATLGMRMMDLEMRTWYGAPCYFVLGAVHAVGFWLSVSFLTPFVLLVGLFNERKRLLHDIVLGTVVINTPARADALRYRRPL